jgi:hypothetical protein
LGAVTRVNPTCNLTQNIEAMKLAWKSLRAQSYPDRQPKSRIINLDRENAEILQRHSLAPCFHSAGKQDKQVSKKRWVLSRSPLVDNAIVCLLIATS